MIQESKGWEELVSEEGVLQKLLAEQRDELCGPRPQRHALGQIGGDSGPEDFQADAQNASLMQLLQQSIEVGRKGWRCRHLVHTAPGRSGNSCSCIGTLQLQSLGNTTQCGLSEHFSELLGYNVN